MEKDKIIFLNDKHKKKYFEFMLRAAQDNAETRAIMYLFALIAILDNNINDLFDFQEHCIKPEGINAAWQTSSTRRTTRLAFVLWNGFAADDEPQRNTIYDIFGYSDWDKYYIQAIQIRYSSTCN